MVDAYLSLGGNIGDARQAITQALALLAERGAIISARSSDYRTLPWGPIAQAPFVNACARLEADGDPHALLRSCLAVETALGRTREIKWGPRLIDIDLLTFGEMRVASADLVLPHPHMFERAFVLVPLVEIAPDLVVDGIIVRDALARLDTAGVVKLD